MNMPLLKKERRPWWMSPWGDEAMGDVWSDRLFPVWQRMKGEEWVPTFNFYEEEGNYKLEAEIPGVNKEDISVTIDKNVVTVSGKKESKVEEKKANYFLLESSYGSFSRSLRLPGEIDEGKVQANFQNGVLRLTMPQKKAGETKQIKIEG
jgi:HSP20 family protein